RPLEFTAPVNARANRSLRTMVQNAGLSRVWINNATIPIPNPMITPRSVNFDVPVLGTPSGQATFKIWGIEGDQVNITPQVDTLPANYPTPWFRIQILNNGSPVAGTMLTANPNTPGPKASLMAIIPSTGFVEVQVILRRDVVEPEVASL